MADKAYVNGVIYTVDSDRPWAEAVAITDGRIRAVGSTAEIMHVVKPETEIEDLAGHFVMPGFIDAHLHFMWGAKYIGEVGARDARTLSEILQRLETYAHQNPGKEWIVGQEFSYGYPDLPHGEFHKRIFDAVVPDRPVFFYSGMAHAAWANSRALEIAGIGRDTPDPEGGIIVRDVFADPTGWLKESAAQLVQRCLPPSTNEERKQGLKAAMQEAARYGVTRVQSAGFDDELFQVLEDMLAGHELTLRFNLSVVADPPRLEEEIIEKALTLQRRFQSEFIRFTTVKLFLDGVLESYTGSMPKGYADRPDERGILLWEDNEFRAAVRAIQGNGLQVWAHAIGTGAISRALDGYEDDIQMSRRMRPRIEHFEIPDFLDIERLVRAGAVASMQPSMIYPKDQWMGMAGVWDRRVGPTLRRLGFPLKAVLDAGGHLAFGTDWPIVDLNPMVGIRNAVLRQSIDGLPVGGWIPAQRITLHQALHAYTMGAAYAGHVDAEEGSISPGKHADLVILSENPFEVERQLLHHIKVKSTIVAGKVVFHVDAPDLFSTSVR